MVIRALKYEDLDVASKVLWKSFYEAEKNHTSMKGMEFFRDLISPVSLSVNTFDGSTRLFGAFDEDLIAVGALKGEGHILLLYVLPDFAKKGIGSQLLSYMENVSKGNVFTLNAAIGAVSFYKKHGYQTAGEEREEEGMIFIPMKKFLKIT